VLHPVPVAILPITSGRVDHDMPVSLGAFK